MALNRRIQLDKEKVRLCNEKNINLVVIPYFEAQIDEDLISFISRKINCNIDIGIMLGYYKECFKLGSLQDIAFSRNGYLLSHIYYEAHTKYRWMCHEGHIWKARASNIRIGKWCPYCYGRNRTIEDMHEFARKFNGKCLSAVYLGALTKLRWQCELKHIWEAIPSSVTRGHWCRKCYFIKKAKRRLKCQA